MDSCVNTRRERIWAGPLLAGVLVGIAACPLLFGFEPVGGDPDRAYRPIKTELAKALAEWRLPHWSDRFGTGMPLIAESHVAAFYPPNWILYRCFEVATAYRISMWLHLVASAGLTAAYGLQCGLERWGSALAGVAFTFCGYHAVHAPHEYSYCAAAYIPLCLWLAQRYVETGEIRWIASLALATGAQWTIGHFQIQTWTTGLILFVGTWRVFSDGHSPTRIVGLFAGLGWAAAVAVVQLWPSWHLAQFVGQLNRSIEARSFYSYPPGHFAELVLPRLFRSIPGGPMAPYWFGQQTTGYEAALFIGTLPLILTFLGARRPTRGLHPWYVLIAGSLLLATMPQWWPRGYAAVLSLPGIGYFRAPARYTLIASLGLALLAGRGLDRNLPGKDFRRGLVMAVTFALLAVAWAIWWTGRPQFASTFTAESAAARYGLPALVWAGALFGIIAWRRGKLPPAGILAFAAVEAAALYYTTATDWGLHVSVQDSAVLTRLRREETLRLVGGEVENYPIYANAATATPYLGFQMPPPANILASAGDRRALNEPGSLRWLRRLGVTHQVWSGEVTASEAVEISRMEDGILDRIVPEKSGGNEALWTIIRLPTPFPPMRAATRVHLASDPLMLVRYLALVDEPDVAHYLQNDVPSESAFPRATRADVRQWDGTSAVVEHDGTCDLIITRTYYPGWFTLVNGERSEVQPVDAGLQSVRIEGAGVSHVELRFQSPGHRLSLAISLITALAAFAVLIAASARNRRRTH